MKSVIVLAFMVIALGSCSNNAEESSTTTDSMTINENAGSSGTSSNGIRGNSDTLNASGTTDVTGTGAGTTTGSDTSLRGTGTGRDTGTGTGTGRGTKRDSL